MVTVVIPVMNEVKTISELVGFCWRDPQVSEVLVVDDGSIDGSPKAAKRAGARVITSRLLGKGTSMEDGVRESKNEMILFLDGDLRNLNQDLISKMIDPLRSGRFELVKAGFSRAAGRVTILTAMPLLQIFFPELSRFKQPLGGIVAGNKELFMKLNFENDYGVDVGILIDAFFLGARIRAVDIGAIEHDSQPLENLGRMARQVIRVILERAHRGGRLDIQSLTEIQEIERQSMAEFGFLARRLGQGTDKLALVDMDGTLLDGRFISRLSQKWGLREKIAPYLDNPALDTRERAKRIAGTLRGIPKSDFIEAARGMPLNKGAVQLVVGLRKMGYRVGIVSDSYFIATEEIRKRVFADFSIGYVLNFKEECATGEVRIPSPFFHRSGCPDHPICKRNVMIHLGAVYRIPTENILAVGDNDNDACLLASAGVSFAFEAKTLRVRRAARHCIVGGLEKILKILKKNKPSPGRKGIQKRKSRSS